MRTLLASALVLLAACGSRDAGDDPSAHGAASASSSQGPDPVVLRVPRGGGVARAYVYPALDSTVWRSPEAVPAPARVLGFDPEAGLLAFEDTRGRAARLDLRLGGISTSGKTVLTGLASADGVAIYGLAGGKISRMTPSGGAWPFQTPAGTREVVPQPDGSVIVVAARRDSTIAWRVLPPDTRLLDTASLPRTRRTIGTQLGDRVYFVADSALHGLRVRDFTPVPTLAFPGKIEDVVTTPSGDRLYVALEEAPEIHVVDRYRDEIVGTIAMPGPVRAVRMDALGRYLLARAARTDSVYVVALGTGRTVGALATGWRSDLPFIAPDGTVALVRGADVVFTDAETFSERRRVAGGASDFWQLVLWNGFRPRARGLDEPVVFARADTADSLAADSLGADTTAAAPDSAGAREPAPAPRDSAAAPAAAPGVFTLSFAALREEKAARELAGKISVDGERARVVTSQVAGTAIYRVVMGPYRSKDEAERRGKASGRDFWVYAGQP